MSSSSLVSIVIPTYNRSDLLHECIESALAQTYRNFEVLVVDDGSTDETPGVCGSFGDRIRYFRKPNGGAASALNYGVGRMKGAWFKWLSSDDLLESGALEALVPAAERANAAVAYGDFLRVDEAGRILGRDRSHDFRTPDDFVLELWHHFVGSAGAAIVRRSCFDQVGLFDVSLRYGEDYDWWLRAAMIYRLSFFHVSAFVTRYRIHPGQVSQSRLVSIPILRSEIRERAAQKLQAGGVDPSVVSHYRGMTKRYRRAFAPLVKSAPLLAKAPGSTTIAYWAVKLVPRLACRANWALNPPPAG